MPTADIVQPQLGERVLVIPQAASRLTNPHRPSENAIGRPPDSVSPVLGSRARDGHPASMDRWSLPTWAAYTPALLRRGFGLMVVRDGKLQVGPSQWDSGD